MQNNAENKHPYKESTYQEFVIWSGLPPTERWKLGIKDQSDFAEAYGVNKDTLTRWKNRADFEPRVNKLQKSWGKSKTADIMQAIYNSAIKGKARSQKLWLDYFTDFKPGGNRDKNARPPLELTENDIRSLIFGMPKWRQQKYFDMLRDLLSDYSLLVDHPEMSEEEYNEINKDGL